MGKRSKPLISRLQRSSLSKPIGDDVESTPTTQPEKSVSFALQAKVRYTLSCDHDYSDEEILACWLTEEETDQIARRCIREIRKMQKDMPSRSREKLSSRGLEGHTLIGSLCRRQLRLDAVNKVMDEQDRQFLEGRIDDEAIARAYQGVTASAQLWAHSTGLRDQREAETIRSDDDDEMGDAHQAPMLSRLNAPSHFPPPTISIEHSPKSPLSSPSISNQPLLRSPKRILSAPTA